MLAVKRCLFFLALAGLVLAHRPMAASPLNDAIRPERVTLDNGLEVWMKSRPGSGSVCLYAAVKAGRRYETLQQRGLAHFVEHMVFEGTGRWSHKGLQQELRARGATCPAATDADATMIWLEVPAADLNFGLEWLVDVLFDSTFPAERVKVERNILLRELEPLNYRSVRWRLMRALFDDNSMVEGPQDLKWELRNTRRLRRDELLRFYREQYVPNNVVLAVAGDFDLVAARARLSEVFGRVRRAASPPRGARADPAAAGKPLRVAGFGSFKRSGLWYGYTVPADTGAHDLEHLRWLFSLVGVRARDRITHELGLAYEVSAEGPALCPETQPRMLGQVWVACRYSDLPVVERIVRQEFARVRSQPAADREVAMVQAQAVSWWRGLGEDNHHLANYLLSYCLLRIEPPDVDRLTAGLTARELQRTARRYLKPERSFVAYYRPYKTPGEIAVIATVVLGLAAGLTVIARRRNAGLAPPPDHVEEALPSRNTLRLVAAQAVSTPIWAGLAVFVCVWLPWKLSEFLFTHAMFGLDFALVLVWAGAFCVVVGAASFTSVVRRVTVSREGVLIGTAGFHILLRPEKIRSVKAGALSMWRLAFDPRVWALGGDRGRWVILRGPLGLTVCLALSNPEEFAQNARAYLGQPSAAA